MKWLFHRRSGRPTPTTTTTTNTHYDGANESSPTTNGIARTITTTPERRRSQRRENLRRSSRDSRRRLQRRRAYSDEVGRGGGDAIRAPDQNLPPVPPLPVDMRSKSRRSGDGGVGGEGLPTLRKRSAQDLPRRKSSKKRKEEHVREAQIRAMVASMPSTTTTTTRSPAEGEFTTSSGRSMTKRESKQMRAVSGMGNGHTRHPNHSSEVSLPSAESIDSSLSSMEDNQPSYVLSALSVLAPHPSIRYAESPKASATYGNLPLHHPTTTTTTELKKRRLSDRIVSALDRDEALHTNRRIDELADDFDATELRELMERDATRRDRKKAEHVRKMERKVARRQERQRRAELEAASRGEAAPVNMERGVLGREVVSAAEATDGHSAVVTTRAADFEAEASTTRETDTKTQNQPTAIRRTPPSTVQQQRSADTFAASSPYPHSPDSDDMSSPSPLFETARAQNLTRVHSPQTTAIHSPPMSPMLSSTVSSTPTPILDAHEATAISSKKPNLKSKSSSRRSSGGSSSNTKPMQSSWATFFRRDRGGGGARSSSKKRASVPEAEFSNTSRDSMQMAMQTSQQTSQTQVPTLAAAATAAAMGTAAATGSATAPATKSLLPKRTMSKFREDLPETKREMKAKAPLPLSPPRSRVQSPATEVPPPVTTTTAAEGGNVAAARYGTPVSADDQVDGVMPLETEMEPTAATTTTAAPPATQSLASIDSEASWLSGAGATRRNSKRSSQLGGGSPRKTYRDVSGSSSPPPGEEEAEAEAEVKDRGLGDSPTMIGPTEVDGAAPTKWGAVARMPNIVHRTKYAKSREGLLHDGMDLEGLDSEDDAARRVSNVADMDVATGDDGWTSSLEEGDSGYTDLSASDPDSPRHTHPHTRTDSDGAADAHAPRSDSKLDGAIPTTSPTTTTMAKAESIDLKQRGHVRHISAGSARLLDLKRSSVDSRLDSRRGSLQQVSTSGTASGTASPVNSLSPTIGL